MEHQNSNKFIMDCSLLKAYLFLHNFNQVSTTHWMCKNILVKIGNFHNEIIIVNENLSSQKRGKMFTNPNNAISYIEKYLNDL